MKLVYLVWGVALAVAACDGGERTAKVDTGTAEATVTTEASRDEVPDIQLQQQAQQAATAASEPVDGSGPVESTTPEPK
jgi:hypothetical protein